MSRGALKLLAGSALIAVLAITACGTSASGSDPTAPRKPPPASDSPRATSQAAAGVHHYLYVFPDQAMYVYDIDRGHRLVQHVSLPGITGIRGAAASPRTHILYISHGGDGGGNGSGSLLAYDLLTNKIVWDRSYSRGIDSMAVSPDGSRIYMPDGELSSDGIWTTLNARGNVIGQISAGTGPHNTIVNLNGKRVYLGGRNYNYLDVASTSTGRVFKRIGPLESGVRPFTINGRETLAYTTATGFLGFQVSSIRSGQVLYTMGFGPRFGYDPSTFSPSAPSHGISLSPDERQVWVIDAPNSYVHVFDVTAVPRHAPRRIADVRLVRPLAGDESGCSYDCARDGWVLVSRNGCFAYVGDSGDVFSTTTFRRVAFLPALRNSRKYFELDWRGGNPVATTTRSGLGYVTHGPRPRRPRCG